MDLLEKGSKWPCSSSETAKSTACLLVGEREATWPTQDLVKPRETKNEDMQRANT